MTSEELYNEIESLKKIRQNDVDKISICVDGYEFEADDVYDYNNINISTSERYPRYSYRFTYLTFDPTTHMYKGITHRTHRFVSDEECINERMNYIPGWKDIDYKIIRIERVLDDSADIYKQIWESK